MGNGRYIDTCTKCGSPMLTSNRMGLCTGCRTVKCGHPECNEMLVLRGSAKGFCRKHTGKVRRKPIEVYL